MIALLHSLASRRHVLPLLLALFVPALPAQPADEPDSGALWQYIGLVAVLSALLLLPVRLPGR